ncbi:MerR family transcriptional regulator [Clostridium sp. WLY-B-L2]|uniref:MerR family transcriptional regulator n=1 Tax=Clostridium aromativorans TaxID=2836848 RepID=A0ABS8N0X9_9CLOT|nr:MerR family transcriptional regulator [Clostridium aromativorans]MCC9293455.1 MerR family transcriptional regulator [Clostridium aromativorans]CAB1252745.1 HTH-type transcriptional regulator AdhR [Clostridiaceae bacterium BL-3]
MNYHIGEFSKKMGLSIDTLRYYEKIGLIHPVRDKINRRIYCERDISWLNFIFRLKETNMPIKQIQHYSELRYKGDSTLKERLELLEKQMNRLYEQKNNIEDNILHMKQKIGIYKKKIKEQEVNK